jgi:hypothetical protein
VGSTRTYTKYQLLGMLVFSGVLLGSNSKLTHIIVFFCVSLVLVFSKLTLTPSTKDGRRGLRDENVTFILCEKTNVKSTISIVVLTKYQMSSTNKRFQIRNSENYQTMFIR